MAVVVTIQGSQYEIVVGTAKPQYVNVSDMDLGIRGDNVVIYDSSSKDKISDAVYSDYTPVGVDAQTVARAIGALAGSGSPVTISSALPAGTNAIGKLAANSGVDIGDVDVTSQPARDRTTDNQGVALQTDVIMNDTTELIPKFAVINAASSGDNTIISAVVGKKIRVLSYTLITADAVDVRWESGAGGTALSGVMSFGANGGVSPAFDPTGHFETASNTLLNMELSAAVQVSGHLKYIEV